MNDIMLLEIDTISLFSRKKQITIFFKCISNLIATLFMHSVYLHTQI